jgi:hypothetical protein
MADEIKNPKENVKMETRGDILTITINKSLDFGPSQSGKSNLVASTGRFMDLGEGLFMMLNLVRKK